MHIDIFNNDAFGVVSLTKAITSVAHQPQRLAELGLFSEEGISTTSVSIESVGSTINLVPAAQRGAPGRPMTNDKRTLRSMSTIHLPQRATIVADEVQNLRSFGAESELETAQGLMNRKLTKMRRDLDTTIEYQRMGAIKGQILDANGVTVLEDLYSAFGVTQTTHNMVLGNTATKVQTRVLEAKRKMELALGGLMYVDSRALCSESFFDAFTSHPAVEKAFDRWMSGEFLRSDNRAGFFFGGVFWEEYRGTVNGVPFIEAGSAYLIPGGVPDLFATYFAPADYMETVNTAGLPYYAKQEAMPFNKGIMVEAQSNPLSLCTRPAVPVRLLAA